MEGVYWLAVLLDAAFPATAKMTHASDVFEEGWLLVQAKWYKYEPDAKHPKGWRGYSLLPEERLLVVASMLRLKDINFESSPRRTLRPAVAPPAVGIQTTLPAAAGRAADGTAGRAGARGRGGGGRGRGARGRGSSCGGGRGGGEPVRQELSWLGVDTHNLIMACVRDEN
jgi:uncharacterized membrane protein YgcG